MNRMVAWCLVLVVTTLVLAESVSAQTKPFKIKPLTLFKTAALDGRVLTCAPYKKTYIAGKKQKRNQFLPAASERVALEKQIKTAQKKRQTVKVGKLQRRLVALKKRLAADNAVCVAVKNPPPPVSPPGTTPEGPQPGAPSDDAVSLEPLTRALTEEDLHQFFDRAGFGLSARESNLKQIGAALGLSALVDAFMTTRAEDLGVWERVVDMTDGQIGRVATHTSRGQRSAYFELWTHTNNMYAEKLALFLLSVFTVSGDVISDETFRFTFWNYFNNIRQATYGDTDLPALGLAITRDPLMLIYLNNELNVRGSPNENYARELMELFTLGTENLDGHPNYTETFPDGSGDIATAARMLTGWKVRLNYAVPALEAQYDAARHEPGPHTMFPGTPWQFTGENDQDLVLGIFAHHPNVKYYYARELLRYYLTPEPPRELIERFAAVIAANHYRLRPAMATLFKSKAFLHPSYKNTLPKDALEFAVGVVKHLRLENGYNAGEMDRNFAEIVMPLNLAPSVFWFSPQAWTSPSLAVEKANVVSQLLGDTGAQSAAEPDWTPALVLPAGSVGADDLITDVAQRIGLFNLGINARAQLLYYLNNERQWDGTMLAKPYNNADAAAQRRKGLGIYYLLFSMPDYQLK